RVVHGGEFFRQAVLIDDSVEARIQSLFTLAPLHNPPNLLGIQAMRRRFPGVLQVAVFDTAFHQSMPEQAFRYAIPETFYLQHGVRRYGAHGTSHRFVAEATAAALGRPLEELQLITAHLGNGCSGCAIRSGLSVETTMGLTPLEGMMMGTRSGDVDPALHQFLALNAGLSLTAITDLLTKQSGLLGVSGTTNDRRVLEAAMQRGDARARLALELFCYRAAKCLLALTAALDRVDALTFTGGIGENSAFIRRRIVEQMPLLGIELVEEANSANGARTGGQISRTDGKACLVIPTNEELAIARETVRMMPSPVGASGN
ncbi:MAG TPA: acetate kinase, partial [Verrucomicrobiales bacterium]|nr:acetate kinase [Verrucomicrobiales bacterium]